MKSVNLKRFPLLIMLLVFVLPTMSAFGQDEPADAQEVVQQYLETGDNNWLADDVEFSDPLSTETIVGRDAVTQRGTDYYGQAYNLNLQPWRYFLAGDTVVVEFMSETTDTTATMNPSAGLDVAIPAVGIYHVENNLITSARLYYDAPTLQTQMGVAGSPVSPAVDPAVGGVADNDPYATLDALTDNPEDYYGSTVTVAGPIRELIGDGSQGMIIVEEDLLGDDPALVLFQNQDMIVNQGWTADNQLLVTGTVHPYAVSDLETELGRDLDDTFYTGYESYPVIIASDAQLIN